MYLIRLDDACEYMNEDKWDKIESLFDSLAVKPIVSVIPHCEDEMFINAYNRDEDFWEKALRWQEKGWCIGLHGYNHVYDDINKNLSINPINPFSEFAGKSYEKQLEKMVSGYNELVLHGLKPRCFVAPGHTFDINTIKSLIIGTDIRIISDTIAYNVYFEDDLYFVPQQCGRLRRLPCKVITGCYHPNTMEEDDFVSLAQFIRNNKISRFEDLSFDWKRRRGLYDYLLKAYYLKKH